MRGGKRGVLISFEGVEGSGKTTQARQLVEWLAGNRIPHVFVRDPGTTRVGEKIREILLDPDNEGMHHKCEVLLFLAARSQLTYEKILPSLEKRKVVVTDRFADSTSAYQSYARRLPIRLISVFNRFATAGIKPDLTFLVDIDIAKGKNRGVHNDRMEREDKMYHQRVRGAYLKIAHQSKKRIKVLDGERSVAALNEDVIRHVKSLLTAKGFKI
jgi:dTMP kinase